MPEVVVKDAQGTEHVFPEGFDPARAAAIVREQRSFSGGVADRLFNAKNGAEPDTYWGGAAKGAIEGMVGGLKGFATGLLPGAVNTVVHTPSDLIKAAIATTKGTGNLLQDPVGTLTKAYEDMKGMPGSAADTIKAALELARQDPEAFGNQVGRVTGGAEAGIGMASMAPLLPGQAGQWAGKTLTQIGKKGAWPIRMMGAHQLGSGNPLGLLTMAIPEGLQKSGEALSAFSGAPTEAELAKLPSGARNVDAKPSRGSVALRVAPSAPSAPTLSRVPYGGAEPPQSITPEPEFPSGARNIDVQMTKTPVMMSAEPSPVPTTPRVPNSAHGEPPVSGAPTVDPETAAMLRQGMSPEAVARYKANQRPATSAERVGLDEMGQEGAQVARDTGFQQNGPTVDKMTADGAFNGEPNTRAQTKVAGSVLPDAKPLATGPIPLPNALQDVADYKADLAPRGGGTSSVVEDPHPLNDTLIKQAIKEDAAPATAASKAELTPDEVFAQRQRDFGFSEESIAAAMKARAAKAAGAVAPTAPAKPAAVVRLGKAVKGFDARQGESGARNIDIHPEQTPVAVPSKMTRIEPNSKGVVTMEDYAAAGVPVGDPSVLVTPEQQAAVKAARAARHGTKYSNAQSDAARKNAEQK